ncbi:hypothetical protein KFE94_07605 [bacterium SCSIO 12643]|nr:hypothetical protein KFE94_07605 [bacterium SCSIO 12643]
MSNKTNSTGIYRITGLAALIYSGLLLVFSLYNQFLYEDGTWVHGFIANGFAVISGLIWISILYFFKRFLNQVLFYRKADLIINAYIVFLVLTVLSLGKIVYASMDLYFSIEDPEAVNSLTAFASDSISSAILILVSSLGIMITSILMGVRILLIHKSVRKDFTILGATFILYGILNLLQTASIIENDTYPMLSKALITMALGAAILKVLNMDLSALIPPVEPQPIPKPKPSPKINTPKPTQKKEPKKQKEKKVDSKPPKKPKRIIQETTYEEVPAQTFDVNQLGDKDLILSYFNHLSKEELSRLESIISQKYGPDLSQEIRTNLIIQHIAQNKMYDHQRYLPR